MTARVLLVVAVTTWAVWFTRRARRVGQGATALALGIAGTAAGAGAASAGSVADEPVAARWFRAASPATVQVWVVPHAGHTQGLTTRPEPGRLT
jgi:hypothetical protein